MNPKIALAGCCAAAMLAEVPEAAAQQETGEPDVQVQSTTPSEPAPSQPVQGQWVYTDQYGWVWVPAGTNTTSLGGEPYAYLYAPAYGWTWLVSPWGWGPFSYGYWPLWGGYRYIPHYYGYGRGLGWGWGGAPRYWGGGVYRGGYYGGSHVGPGYYGGGHVGGGYYGGGHVGGGFGGHVGGGHVGGGGGHR